MPLPMFFNILSFCSMSLGKCQTTLPSLFCSNHNVSTPLIFIYTSAVRCLRGALPFSASPQNSRAYNSPLSSPSILPCISFVKSIHFSVLIRLLLFILTAANKSAANDRNSVTQIVTVIMIAVFISKSPPRASSSSGQALCAARPSRIGKGCQP